jgi:hypothetical protein
MILIAIDFSAILAYLISEASLLLLIYPLKN